LFGSTWETFKTFSKAKEIQMGMIAVLHNWGQQLSLQLYLYCIVPDGNRRHLLILNIIGIR
jgi:hypothetical protein